MPKIDPDTYRLIIQGIGTNSTSLSLSLQDIKTYPKVTLPVTLECGGNRRSQMGKVRPAPGIEWTGGAIGNAIWSGASLKAVLISAGFNILDYDQQEIHLQVIKHNSRDSTD